MLAAIDHVIIACRDPDSAAAEIERALGLRATGGGRHDSMGTFNRLVWLGDSFLELVGVFDEAIAANSWFGSHVVGILRDRPAGFAGLAFRSTDLAVDVAALRAQGSSILEPVDGERGRPDGRVVRWRVGRLPETDHDLGLAFLIEHDTAAAEWSLAERATRAAELHPAGTPASLKRVELPVARAAPATQRFHRDLGLAFRPSLAGVGARDSSVGIQTVRLVPGHSLPTIALTAGFDSRDLGLLGCRWLVEPNRK